MDKGYEGNSNKLIIKMLTIINNQRSDNCKYNLLPDHKHKIGKKNRKNWTIRFVVEEARIQILWGVLREIYTTALKNSLILRNCSCA